MQTKLNNCYESISKLKCNSPFSPESLQSSDYVQFCTGLPNFKVLNAVFDYVVPPKSNAAKKSYQVGQFPGVYNCFSQAMLGQSIARICVSVPYIYSNSIENYLKWLTMLDIKLKPLIKWPDRAMLWTSTPACYRASFGKKVVVILDCFEIFIERPSNLLARASTKHHNTVKVLIGIAPQGVVSFVSDTRGGRVSDKYLTDHCGILNYLLPSDVVLADWGFDIAESVGVMQAKLHIPSFTKEKDQLSALEVEDTRSIANVRIHVEHVIGAVRQKYTILKGTLPIDFMIKRDQEDIPLVDRIVRVCCALYNICDSVVPFD